MANSRELRVRAQRCLAIAAIISDQKAVVQLKRDAAEYQAQAAALEKIGGPRHSVGLASD